MQRAFSVLFSGLVMFFQAFSADAAGYEHEGTTYHFRQNDVPAGMQSAIDAQAENPGNLQEDQSLLKSLEDQGYVFRPMRKRKTLEDRPQDTQPEGRRSDPQQEVQACPAPMDPPAVSRQLNPLPVSPPVTPYPVAPPIGMPPLGYPYSFPSPYSYPYPAGGLMPFPGGFGMP
jgi:hypothetical protein